MIVRHAGKELSFDWSQEEASVEYDHVDKRLKLDGFAEVKFPKIQWAAFYSDCEHEVLEVKSGHRITLTYNLYTTTTAASRIAGSATSPLDATQLEFYKEFQAALANRNFYPDGHVLGTDLVHAYAHTSEHLQLIPRALKGSDM